MKFSRTNLNEVFIVEPKIWQDERGYFFESFRTDLLENFLGFKLNFVQDNESKSKKGVFRGIHYQKPPFAQSKLVRVIKGAVLDIAVDLRFGSPNFGKFVVVELNETNKKQLFIPRGFGHGFLVLSDEAIFSYKVDNYYNENCDHGINFKEFDFDFLDAEILLSEKDKNQPGLKNNRNLFEFGVNYYA